MRYREWRQGKLNVPGKKPPALEELYQWPRHGVFGRSVTPERQEPKASKTFLTQMRRKGEKNLQLLRDMFDDFSGFGNPTNLKPATNRDRGMVRHNKMKEYVKAFVPGAHDVEHMSKDQLFQALAGGKDSALATYQKVLGPAGGGRGPQHAIERFLANDRGPERSRSLELPDPIELVMPGLEQGGRRSQSREPEDVMVPSRVVDGVTLTKTDKTHGAPPATPAQEILDLTQEHHAEPDAFLQNVDKIVAAKGLPPRSPMQPRGPSRSRSRSPSPPTRVTWRRGL